MNPILNCDGYKLDHRRQYPEQTKFVYSNWTPRASRVKGQNEVVLFGLQYFLKKYLIDEMYKGFFIQDLDKVGDKYLKRINSYLGPNPIGTKHIEALWDLGYIPLRFWALPEGTLCPLRVPMIAVENTNSEFFWVTNYFEPLLSTTIWLPCTSATTAYRLRSILNGYCKLTLGDPNFVGWQGHDFSLRGMAGLEAAEMSGAGHLISFDGTDTLPAIEWIEDYYGGTFGGSVAATEHSVMCAGGELTELETFERILDLYPTGIVSIVSDTWDLWKVITEILPKLKDKIMNRDGKVVIRPDSGDPVKILCGDPQSDNPNTQRGVVQLLWNIFGGEWTVDPSTQRYFKQLDPHIGCIYGDSINEQRMIDICGGLYKQGFKSTNVVFGIGSYTYQYVTRDVYGFAMKATFAQVGNEGRPLFKKPITDDGEKFSAKGRLAVVKKDSRLTLIENATPEQELSSELKLVWENGKFIRKYSFQEVRNTLWPGRG